MSAPQIHLSNFQSEMICSSARFVTACCGRRSGKTTIARIKAYLKAVSDPGSRIWIVAKTYSQAHQLYWDHFVGDGRPVGAGKNDRLLPKEIVKNISKASLTIELINGSIIQLKGSDSPESLLGEGLDLLILDEFQSQSPDVWYKLYPMVSDTGGEVWIIGTPRGFNHFYDKWWLGWPENPNKHDMWESWLVTTEQAGQVSSEEIELAKATLSWKEFRQEYMASFENLSGVVYSEFSQTENVDDKTSLHPLDSRGEPKNPPLLIGMDFNVNKMCAVVCVKEGRELWAVDEIVLENSNTREMAQEIKGRYPDRQKIIYPDPSGSRRQASAVNSDHQILRQNGFTVQTKRSHPAVKDRVNEVNAMLCNAKGERRLLIHPGCQELIKCLKGQTYNENGDPDKKLGLDHMPDALGYLVDYIEPIRKNITQQDIW